MANTPNLEIYLTKTQEIRLLKGNLASLQNIIMDLEEENKVLKDAIRHLYDESAAIIWKTGIFQKDL
jgi:hypothetical protein